MNDEDRARFILWWDVTGGGNTSLRAVAEQAWISATRIERGACARLCESDESGRDGGGYFAKIIRSRSNKP
jgi:hypothetical protein